MEFIINKCHASIHSYVVTLINALLYLPEEIINAYCEENKYNINNEIAKRSNNRIEKMLEARNANQKLNIL